MEEEFAALANKDIAQLCAENIMLWQKFLDAFTLKEPIHQHLSKLHHQLRVSCRNSKWRCHWWRRDSGLGCISRKAAYKLRNDDDHTVKKKFPFQLLLKRGRSSESCKCSFETGNTYPEMH